MAEQWRVVEGWPQYSVSDLGRVRGPRKMLTLRVKEAGYQVAHLRHRPSGRAWTPLVHRLVARAFLGPCPEGKQVNHINSVRTDNRVSNLEYLTPSENCRHRRTNGTYPEGENNGRARLTRRDVGVIRALRTGGATFKAIATQFGVHKNTARMAALGESWGSL
jgi:hypothetical protein